MLIGVNETMRQEEKLCKRTLAQQRSKIKNLFGGFARDDTHRGVVDGHGDDVRVLRSAYFLVVHCCSTRTGLNEE